MRNWPAKDRILASILVDGHSGCWIWRKSVDRGGYASICWNSKMMGAHRLAYQAFVGVIPAGLELDHLCRVTRCVNPAHLEAVTPRENTLRSNGVTAINARKSHCHKGHEYTPENTRKVGNSRWCRQCDVLRNRTARTLLAERAK